ncbi:MAG: tRNA epoxyqueuosine(34) reductase QueG, partial [Hyphomicrobiales bacterium]|nr:tRNA epoxyqueuosine(34) reductase QueG [Hyphomicrobiales bacterium]
MPDLKTAIRRAAGDLGFAACGFAAAAGDPADARALAAFLHGGRHGTMDWMAATADRRGAPTALWPEARTVIALGLNYGPGEDPLAALARR